MFNLFKHELSSRWLTILGWGIGLTLWGSMYIAVYPSMASEMQALAGIQLYKALGIDLASFAGYMATVVVQLMPLVLGFYVITVSTSTLAGEEENGTLEMVVAMPLPRWQIVAMKTVALSLVVLLIMGIMGLGNAITLSIVSQSAEVDATPLQLFVGLLGSYPMLLVVLTMGLFFGAILPSRRMAIAIMIFFYLGSYVLNSIAMMIEAYSWLKTISLFAYVNSTATVFSKGHDLGNMLILFVVALLFFVLAMWSFQGRNITVGQWPWQRGKMPVRKAQSA